MNLFRWLLSVPAAVLASFTTWALLHSALGYAYYGGGLIRSFFGLAPLFATAAIPAISFVVAGVSVSPSKGRVVAFVYFPFAMLFSVGGMEMIRNQHFSHVFWMVAVIGQLSGGFTGLLIALRLQNKRIRNEK